MKTTTLLLVCLCFLIGCASTPDKKYAKTSTPELKLRHAQCVQFLTAEKKAWEFRIGRPLPWETADGGRADRIKEKEEIEQALMHRWQAGDKEAYLPVFGAAENSK